MKPVDLLIVGGGRMGEAILRGLETSTTKVCDAITVIEIRSDRRQELSDKHPNVSFLERPEPDVLKSDGGALLAVKPVDAEGTTRTLGAVGVTRLVSIVAGVATQRLEDALPPGAAVVRAMPNSPALVGRAITAMSGGSNVKAADLEWAEQVLQSIGHVIRLPERDLDAVTGLSGSGPAYVFLMVEALTEAGVLAGLSWEASQLLVVETLAGSVELLKETGHKPEFLRAMVTSPSGTTAAGLRSLEARAVRSAFIEAVMTATERSRQLGVGRNP